MISLSPIARRFADLIQTCTAVAVASLALGFLVLPVRGQSDLAAVQVRAAGGELEALNTLANAYANGQGVPQNYAEAIRLYQQAASRGFATAQFNLGLLYELGRGVAPDVATAFGYYLKAAEQGLTAAQFNVGNMYANGIGVRQDYLEALLWLRQAAEHGLPEAQYNVALAYEHGRGAAKDEAAALRWYRMAAAQGNVRAQYNLAAMLEEGRGEPADPAAAVGLYRAAAVQNFTPAQHNLGILLAAGRGTPPDAVEAYKWLALAVENGADSAARDAVARQLTNAQLAEANLSLSRARSLLTQQDPASAGLATSYGSAGSGAGPARPAASPTTASISPLQGVVVDADIKADPTRTDNARLVDGTGEPEPSRGAIQYLSGRKPALNTTSLLLSPPDSWRAVPTTEIPLQQLAARDPRIAKLIQENTRLNTDLVNSTLRLLQINRQLRALQENERSSTGSATTTTPDRNQVAELTNRVDILRNTIAKLAEENRWHYAAGSGLRQLRTQNEEVKADLQLSGKRTNIDN